MKKSNSKQKAQSAFKKLGAVALITATIFFVACNQAGGGGNTDGGGEGGKLTPTPTPKPKHAITFNVDGANGKIKAKAEGMATETEKSPISVEEDKTVTFTATADYFYRVKEWKVDGKPIADVGKSNTYTHTVKKPVTITVSFEAIPEYAITFSVEGTNGTLKAMINGEEITSGTEIEEGKTVTFTAMPEASYRVKEWKVDGKPVADAGKSNTYAHTVTKVATITVSFELTPKHAITFSVDGANGKLTAKADGIDETETSPLTVEEGKTITFTATANAGYKVKEWKVDDTALQDNKENTYTHTVTQASTIKVSFELLPAGTAILTLDPNKLSIRVTAKTADGSTINVKGCTVATLASDSQTTLTATDTKIVLKGKITELDCNWNKLVALNVQGLTALQKLNCALNQLPELNVQGLTALQKLDCSYNHQLTSLNASGCTSLQELDYRENEKLASLDAHGCTALEHIRLDNDQLTSLNVSGCISLQSLSCPSLNNKLTSLNASGCTSLKELSCSSNDHLTALNVQGCTSLQKLYCYLNKLTALDVSGLTSLQRLRCHGNQLTELNIQGCTALKELDCYGNQLNVQAMTKLLNALPQCNASNKGETKLYTEKTYWVEGNCKNYTKPAELKAAFDDAKNRNWELKKINAYGGSEDL